ncbi:type II toxin-antitoxin system RelE/ParE family toxin [Haliea sp. E1-2-M8]|uniref:type II toxin-antitoxin system RelE/ParE family toxin n=1 Tax=Haliea sp. E1-2-M8 TaxID=3064706 RepID=UPI00351C44ED
MIIRLREEAEVDLEDAASWYESQRSGLGRDFLDTVLQALELIEQSPLSFPIVYPGTHRVVPPKFPFAVFYIIRESEISVLSVMHGSRHPARWQQRT